MKKNRIIAGCLLALFLSLGVNNAPIAATSSTKQESLQDFIKNTDNIDAYYKYPSMKLTTNSPGKSILRANTPIVIRCTETITTRDVVSGSTVNFAVVTDINDSNGNILIKAGTPVTAQISFAKTKGLVGTSGELTITDFHTTAVDGTYVPLSGTVSANPNDKMVLSVVLSVVVCPLFLLMKGEDEKLLAGTTKTAYTVSQLYIKPIKA